MNFGVRLKKIHKNKHLTQQQLADRLGVAKSVVSYYETGDRFPSYDVLIKIARTFHVTTDYLLKDAPEEAAPKAAAPWDVLWLLGLVPLAFGLWGLLRMLPWILTVLDMGAREALWMYFPHLLAYGVLVAAGAVLLLYGYRNQHK